MEEETKITLKTIYPVILIILSFVLGILIGYFLLNKQTVDPECLADKFEEVADDPSNIHGTLMGMEKMSLEQVMLRYKQIGSIGRVVLVGTISREIKSCTR